MQVRIKADGGFDLQNCSLDMKPDNHNQEISYNPISCTSVQPASGTVTTALSDTDHLSEQPVKTRIDDRSIDKTKQTVECIQYQQNQLREGPDSGASHTESGLAEQILCSWVDRNAGFKPDDYQSSRRYNSAVENNAENTDCHFQKYQNKLPCAVQDEDSEISSSDDSTVVVDIAGPPAVTGCAKKNLAIAFIKSRVNPGLLSKATLVYGPALVYTACKAYQYSLPENYEKGEDGEDAEVLPSYLISRTAAALVEGALVAGVIPLLEICADKLSNLKVCNSYIFRHLYSRKIEMHKVAGTFVTAAGAVHTGGHLARAGIPVLTTQEGITALLMLMGNFAIAGSYLSLKSDFIKKRLTYLTIMKTHKYGAYIMVGLLAAHNRDRRLLPFLGCLSGFMMADRLLTHVNHRFVTPIYATELFGSQEKHMCIQAELPAKMAAPNPGQYFKLKLPELDDVAGYRNFTSGGVIDGKIQFVISKAGIGTKKIFNAVMDDYAREQQEQVGALTKLQLIGPFSSSLESILYRKRVVMITSGAGCNLITAKLLHHYKSSVGITMLAVHCCTEPGDSLSIIRALASSRSYIGGSIHLFYSGSRISDDDYRKGLEYIKNLLSRIENANVYEQDGLDKDNGSRSKHATVSRGFTIARQTRSEYRREGEESVNQSSLRTLRVNIYNKTRISTEFFPDKLIGEAKLYLTKNERDRMPVIYCCGNKVCSDVATSLNSLITQSECNIIAEYL